ncbi:MAG: hypothetical protein EXS37_07855 [Opitutus sp.]|nr:hypothetical protein [Opitutus sp.]
MKKLLALTVAAALLAMTGARAAETATKALVLKIIGSSAQVLLPGASAATVLAEGAQLPEGATIITGAGTEVYLKPFEGAVSTIKENSTVGLEKLSVESSGGTVSQQTATLDLKSGNIVSSLDPAKKKINNYGVRTPKGVAAARGTTYTVSLDGGTYTIVTGTGTVTITPEEIPGQPPPVPVSIAAGKVSVGNVNGGAPAAASTFSAAYQAVINRAAAIAVAAVAVVSANPTRFGVIAATASGELSGVMTTVVQDVPNATAQAAQAGANAAPTQATAIVTAAVKAAAGATGATAASITAVAQTVTQAASAGVTQAVANSTAQTAVTNAVGSATGAAATTAAADATQNAAQTAAAGAVASTTAAIQAIAAAAVNAASTTLAAGSVTAASATSSANLGAVSGAATGAAAGATAAAPMPVSAPRWRRLRRPRVPPTVRPRLGRRWVLVRLKLRRLRPKALLLVPRPQRWPQPAPTRPWLR